MFTAAFLIVAKIWKQPESPSRDKWMSSRRGAVVNESD